MHQSEIHGGSRDKCTIRYKVAARAATAKVLMASASAFLRHEYASLDIYRTIAHYDGEGTTK